MKGNRFGYLLVSDSDEDSDDAKAVERRELHSGGGDGASDPHADLQVKDSITPNVPLSAPAKEPGLDVARHSGNLGNRNEGLLNSMGYASNPSPIASRAKPDVLNGAEHGLVSEATDPFTSLASRADDHFLWVASEHVYGGSAPQRVPSNIQTQNGSPRGDPRAGNIESGVQIERQPNIPAQPIRGNENYEHPGLFGMASNFSRAPIASPPRKLPKRAEQAVVKYSMYPNLFNKQMLIAPEVPLPIQSQVPRTRQNLDAAKNFSGTPYVNNENSGPFVQNPPQFSSAPVDNLTDDAIAQRRSTFPSYRQPLIPTPFELKTESSCYDLDDEGNMVPILPTCVRRVVNADGTIDWVLISRHLSNASFSMHKISSPPSHLSRRAQKILGLRDSLKADAQENIIEKAASNDDHKLGISEDVIEVKENAQEDIVEEAAPENDHEQLSISEDVIEVKENAQEDIVEEAAPENDHEQLSISEDVIEVKENAQEDIVEEAAPENDHEQLSISEDVSEEKAVAWEDNIEETVPEHNHKVSVPIEEIYENPSINGTSRGPTFTFPSEYYFSNMCLQKHVGSTLASKNWTDHPYDHQVLCRCAWGALMTDSTHSRTEKMVRILQPIQPRLPTDAGNRCECIIYDTKNNVKLSELLCSPVGLKKAFGKYLNMQPMLLDNTKLIKIADELAGSLDYLQFRSLLSRPMGRVKITKPSGDTARLVGELPCTVEPLCEDVLSGSTAKSLSVRVMRICGGLISGPSLRDNDGCVLDVRRYELFLFLPDSACPTPYSCGPGCPTLGQLTSPPISSFPLTPRIISDPMELSTCREKLRVLNTFEDIEHLKQGDQVSFDAISDGITKEMQFLTLTLATLNTRKKFTIDLTLMILPYRTCCKSGDEKVLAELPPFSPDAILKSFRMRAISLSFSTKSAFMSAYMSLLWATECNIHLIRSALGNCDEGSKGTPLPLRVSATISPLMPRSSSFEMADPSAEPTGIYWGHCINFANIALSASIDDAQPDAFKRCDDLKLEDLFIEKYTCGYDEIKGRKVNDSRWGVATVNQTNTFDYHPKLLQQYCRAFMESRCFGGIEGDEQDAIVGYTPFGIVYRALNQKTREMFDMQVVPRQYVCLGHDLKSTSHEDGIGEADEAKLQDKASILLLKYTSRLPFQPRVYDIYSNSECYYILQEPWLSILALEQFIKSAEHRKMIECNVLLKQVHDHTSVISLKDFIHAVLNPLHCSGQQALDAMEVRLQIVRFLITQLLLLIASLHGKGVLLGPCSTHRILVQINAPILDTTKQEDSCSDDNSSSGTFSSSRRYINTKSLSLFVPGIGVHTTAWNYERQQCGVLEYLSPMYVFEVMANGEIGTDGRTWTMQDDWWTLLSISFELLAADGSTLVCPGMKGAESFPIALASLNSKFVSPNHILDLWKSVLTNQEISAHTMSETISARIRNYVQCRVLESVAPVLDSWLASKVEETKHAKAAGMGLTEEESNKGAVLTSEAIREGIDISKEPLLSPKETKFENAMSHPLLDVLSGIPWIVFYRDWFDTVMDIALPSFSNSKCAVHGPLLYLLSHPFLGAMDVGAVFDGTYRLPHAAEEFFDKHMGKTKLRQALFLYRTQSQSVSKTNSRNEMHSQPRPGTEMDTNSAPKTLRPPSLQRPTDRKVNTHNIMNFSTPSELLSSQAQLPRRVRQNLLQSLYASDEITSIDWLESEVDNALHPRADQKTADVLFHNGRVSTGSGILYDPKVSGAVSSNHSNASMSLKPSSTILSPNKRMQHFNGIEHNGLTGKTYSTTTLIANYKRNGDTSLGGAATNSYRSLHETPKGMELDTKPLKKESVKVSGLAIQPSQEKRHTTQPQKILSSEEDTVRQNAQQVSPGRYTLKANGYNVDSLKTTSSSNAYFPDRTHGSAPTYSASQQNSEWKVPDYHISRNDVPVTSVSKSEQISENIKGHTLTNESQDDGFTVLVPSDSDDMDENTPVLHNKVPHCYHTINKYNRRLSQ